MDAAATTQAAAPLAHVAAALTAQEPPERRVHDYSLSPRVEAFCSEPRTRTDVRLELGEKAIETLKNLVRQRRLVNLGPGPDGLARFVQAGKAGAHEPAPRRVGVRAQMVLALQAARQCIRTDRSELADSYMSPDSNEIDDADALAALAEYDMVLRQIDTALSAAGVESA